MNYPKPPISPGGAAEWRRFVERENRQPRFHEPPDMCEGRTCPLSRNPQHALLEPR